MIANSGEHRSLTPPLKWHGGKHYLAKRIVGLMPPHVHYVEPFAGGLSVLLAKNPDGVSEVVNDLNGRLTSFWRVLQDELKFSRFSRIVQALPFSEKEWQDAEDQEHGNEVDQAASFFVRCRMSLAGRGGCFAPLSRTRTRRGRNEQVSAWENAVEGLPAVSRRLRRVAILNRTASETIRTEDGPDTLFYLDPPYLPSTRTSRKVYAHEMTQSDHQDLLARLLTIRGKVIISGYPNEMYDETLVEWNRHQFELPNNSAGGRAKRRMVEIVWCNF
jgi:DNA adenine methylase